MGLGRTGVRGSRGSVFEELSPRREGGTTEQRGRERQPNARRGQVGRASQEDDQVVAGA